MCHATMMASAPAASGAAVGGHQQDRCDSRGDRIEGQEGRVDIGGPSKVPQTAATGSFETAPRPSPCSPVLLEAHPRGDVGGHVDLVGEFGLLLLSHAPRLPVLRPQLLVQRGRLRPLFVINRHAWTGGSHAAGTAMDHIHGSHEAAEEAFC